MTTSISTGSALAHPSHAPVTDLDVRDDLRSGREPFSRIMAVVDGLPAGGVLHLRATFEPVPLFKVLSRRGFVYETREHAEEDWSVWFWRPDAAPAASPPPPAVTAPSDAGAAPADVATGPHVVWLDVRWLEPPEPLVQTLAALETLPPDHELVQVNVRVPQFLLPMLAERGFAYEVNESHTDRVYVRIWRAR